MTIVYKYLPPERATYLDDEMLRFSQPSALNDPFECLPALPDAVLRDATERAFVNQPRPGGIESVSDRAARRRAQRVDTKASLKAAKFMRSNSTLIRQEFMESSVRKLDAQLGIFSLSRRWDSGLMWSHYAASHSGFCLGFRRNHNLFETEGAFAASELGLREVRYSEVRPRLPDRRLSPMEALEAAFTKSLDWKYECEERLFALLSGAAKTISSRPYPIALFEVPHEALSEILIGLRVDAPLKKRLISAARRLRIPVFQTQLSEESFDLVRLPEA